MNSDRQNFLDSVNHLQPEKMVVDFGSTAVTGIHCLPIEKLRKYYGLEYRPVQITDPFQMLGKIEDDLAEIMQISVTGVFGPKNKFGAVNHEPFRLFKTHWGQEVLVPETFVVKEDEKGNFITFPQGDAAVPPSAKMPRTGYFFDAIVRQHPVVEEDLNPEDNLEEFGPVSKEELDYWKVQTDKARNSGKAVIASFGGTGLGDIGRVPGIQLKNPKGIRDEAEWYMSTLMRPDYVKAVFEKQTEIALCNFEKYHQVVGDNIDAVIICGTDFGTQNSTFYSPEQFDDLWLPYYRKINDWIHSHTNWKTFKHSCGAVESLMPKFIEAGFDIINPVQLNAAGMDPVVLKRKYGKDLVFWGGGVDTQKTLPYATPQKVKDEIFRLCDIFAPGGGFVFNPVHNIQANVPTENLVAMIEAINEINGIKTS